MREPDGYDYAHNPVATANRQAKAHKLALGLELLHQHPLAAELDYTNPTDPPTLKRRRAAEKAAGVARCSDETWLIALREIREHPLRRDHDQRAPGCQCEPAVVGGPLYEFPITPLTGPNGWPCPHDPTRPDTWPHTQGELGLASVTDPATHPAGSTAAALQDDQLLAELILTRAGTRRPEICPWCSEVVCDADCRLAAAVAWPTEADQLELAGVPITSDDTLEPGRIEIHDGAHTEPVAVIQLPPDTAETDLWAL